LAKKVILFLANFATLVPLVSAADQTGKDKIMRIVIDYPLIHASVPTSACFFCGHPIIELGIFCFDETDHDKVLGLVCTSCVECEPAQLQAALVEKVGWLRGQSALLERQAGSLLAQADRLDQLARQSLTIVTSDTIEWLVPEAA
jgi:hypothetical protein